MTNGTMGERICARRKEKGMTQRELADLLHVTDKAVSKWERDQAFPDTGTIPKLAEVLGISVEELMTARPAPAADRGDPDYLAGLVLRALPVAMGAAVTVIAVLGQLTVQSGFILLGIGLTAAGIYLLRDN